MGEDVVRDHQVGAEPSPADRSSVLGAEEPTSVGMPAAIATSATLAAGSTPSTGMPAADEVPEQVAVVARDLDHLRGRAEAEAPRAASA